MFKLNTTRSLQFLSKVLLLLAAEFLLFVFFVASPWSGFGVLNALLFSGTATLVLAFVISLIFKRLRNEGQKNVASFLVLVFSIALALLIYEYFTAPLFRDELLLGVAIAFMAASCMIVYLSTPDAATQVSTPNATTHNFTHAPLTVLKFKSQQEMQDNALQNAAALAELKQIDHTFVERYTNPAAAKSLFSGAKYHLQSSQSELAEIVRKLYMGHERLLTSITRTGPATYTTSTLFQGKGEKFLVQTIWFFGGDKLHPVEVEVEDIGAEHE